MNTTNTTTPRETWKTIGTSKTGRKTYQISNLGRCKTINNKTGEQTTSWGLLNRQTGYLWFVNDYVHRHVAKAFLKKPTNAARTEVQHLDANKHNCAASNLEWATVKENNSNAITNQRRREGHVHTSHAGQVIRGEKNGVVKYWKNGIECARDIGSSHVLVYNSLNKRQSARKARGWSLSWIDLTEVK